MGRSGKFSFIVKMRYAEIIDEDITDLLALPQDKFGDPIQVNYNEWEGYSLNKCNWVTLSNSSQLSEVFLSGKLRRDNSSGEFGKMSSKSSGVLIIEVIQTFESHGECVIVNYILTKVNANLEEIDGILRDHLGSIKDERHNSAILQSRKESLEYKSSLTNFKEKRMRFNSA